jgi:hypothetical protein
MSILLLGGGLSKAEVSAGESGPGELRAVADLSLLGRRLSNLWWRENFG